MSAVEARSLSVRAGQKVLLADVTFALGRGEVGALIGPSGAGKSTLLRAIAGLVAPSAGEIAIEDRVASRAGSVVVAPADRGVSMVFQDLALWPHLTAAAHLDFVLRAICSDRDTRRRKIEAWLDRLGLSDKTNRHPGDLSGGERQRLAIARALAPEPKILLLDEPLSNVDVLLRQEILALLRDLLAEQDTTALYVAHDPREALSIAPRWIVLENGSLAHDAQAKTLLEAPPSAFLSAFAREIGSH